MKNEKKYNIRYNKNTPTAKTMETTQPVGTVCGLDAASQRRSRNTQGQTKRSSCSYAANGFLKCSFLPKLKEIQIKEDCERSAKTERDFYQSLSQLAEYYSIEPMETKQYLYPYNIALALEDIRELLKESVRDWDELKLLQNSRKTFLISTERYNTYMTLYYIPIVPLYRLLKNPKRKQAAQLLVSACTYLYSIADVPYYRQENSFLYWQYEMLKEWILSDDFSDETPALIGEIDQAEWIGDYMEQKICNPVNLYVFEKRLTSFNSKDDFDNDCWKIASEAFCLYKKYPDATIFKNAKPIVATDDDDMEYVVTMDKYVSFCAGGKGELYENLEQTVNSDLQEYGQMEEPIINRKFDGKKIAGDTLDFENCLFSLIEDLIHLLKNI